VRVCFRLKGQRYKLEFSEITTNCSDARTVVVVGLLATVEALLDQTPRTTRAGAFVPFNPTIRALVA